MADWFIEKNKSNADPVAEEGRSAFQQHLQRLAKLARRHKVSVDTLGTTGEDQRGNDISESLRDSNSTFDLTTETYFPDDNQPGGALSNILDCIPIGEEVKIRGPTGNITHHEFGNFVIEGEKRRFERVLLVLGDSGITPGYALIARILLMEGDKTQLCVIDANKSEQDILFGDELDRFEKDSGWQLRICYILSSPIDGGENGAMWKMNTCSFLMLINPPSLQITESAYIEY
ncbi:hypothetical protein B0T18DRAFT_388403 [Schizothecium vesticola]|uniref:Oxidoreductase FAD/NAD(P)-binding domain-containing protein n=1 Tax=Schizothecium vesticola TaxID=314040 RepID=A0AA40F743_9PEZI|nr:hypothetical protein B0T18DRAFT_388403 [Schizothecium vesticola]